MHPNRLPLIARSLWFAVVAGLFATTQSAWGQGKSCAELRDEFTEILNQPNSLSGSLIIKVAPDKEGSLMEALGGSGTLVSRAALGSALGEALADDAGARGEHLPNLGVTHSTLSKPLDLTTFLNPASTSEELCNAIEYIEPDRLVHRSADGPEISEILYGIKNIGIDGGLVDADVDAPEGWDLASTAEEVVVGVVDSGIDYNHPDLRNQMFRNPGETLNALDDDGNGYVDDIFGITRTCSDAFFGFCGTAIVNGNPMDENGHGTHVAGTIGAEANGFGVVGVARNVKLLGLRFLNHSGSGSFSNAQKVVDYAIQLKSKGINIRVLNNSWGSDSKCSSSDKDMVAKVTQAGILFVAAAGNSGLNLETSGATPADCPGVLAVAAVNSKARLASFSNYGATKVAVAAPGVDIYSTWPTATDPFRPYNSISGTSMACPHVAGVAAMVFGKKPQLTPTQMSTLLSSTVKKYPELTGKVASAGIVSAKNALAAP